MKILVAYDGTIYAKKALTYGLEKAKTEQGQVMVVQVFDSRLFIDYDAGPRAEELARAEAKRMYQIAGELLRAQGEGIESRLIFEEGDAAAVIGRYVAQEHVDLILAPPRYKGLAKTLARPVLVIPGTVLVPVDNTDTAYQNFESIVRQAQLMGSPVHLTGIVPVHLYSREETEEVGQVKRATGAAMLRLAAALRERSIAVTEELRFGFPDEEILKSAEAQSASLILLPSGGATPSELSKAAAVILEEPDRIKWPVFLFSQPSAA